MSRLRKYLSAHSPDQQHTAAIAYLAALDHIETVNPSVTASIIQELKDERSHLKLIASENFSSLAVQLAMGNLLTDKYAEGYAHHRFYAGCDNVDKLEEEAQNELIRLYRCDHAYVQPHSGADANLVALWAILLYKIQNPEMEKLGKKTLDELTAEEYENIRQLMVNQKLMGMSLNSGGHLTHGYRHNISSKMLRSVLYDVDPQTELLDYGVLARQVQQEKPTILMAGYSAHPRRLNFAKMREIADSVGAVLMVDMAHFAGLVAGQVFTGEFDPIPYAHVVTSTTHKTLRGPRGGFVLCQKEFSEVVNKGCPVVLGGPLPHVIAAKAVAFKEANMPAFKSYAQKIVENAQYLAGCFLKKGARLVTGGTENHLMIVDVSKFGLTGRQAESLLREAKITVNRNAIPFDSQGPWYTSGIRLGTPALTTLGMGKEEMEEIADIIFSVLSHAKPALVQKTGQPSKANAIAEPQVLESARSRVAHLLARFPLYPEIEI
ncbi:glycine hydroxymethyltransferase [Candidatus Protochlamydia phocaeensis]|uniref:glycine hydroxymethyltransferase n=1 Tax=Candidatus Protochlamydia phocaeensis TaxID=1414722 RepID=UPI000838D9BC|nr:glycine hydroxymethyltransferase [Candidatus Protochlamydia phocaeensis]